MLLFWAAAASAVECADPSLLIGRIEGDVASNFLNDAQRDLDTLIGHLGCSGPVSADLHRRVLQAQGMIWSLQDDARYEVTFAASRVRDDTWPDNLWGASGRERDAWEATLPEAEPVLLSVDGLEADDTVWLDGVAAEAPLWLRPGPHILQVGQDEQARYARLIFADGPVQVRVPRAAVTAMFGVSDGPPCTSATSCVELVRSLQREQPDADHPAIADALLRDHCEDDSFEACVALTALQDFPDAEAAAPAWACIDEPMRCIELAEALPTAALTPRLLEVACEADTGTACLRRADRSQGLERQRWLQQACRRGVACDVLREVTERNERALLARSCDEEAQPVSCLELAERLDGERFRDRDATDWLEAACLLGEVGACERYQREVAWVGLGVEATRLRLRALRDRCDQGEEPAACGLAERLLLVPVTHPLHADRLELLARGCELGDAKLCVAASHVEPTRATRAINDDPISYLRRGCDLDDDLACAELGLRLSGVRKTSDTGQTLLRTRCKQGSSLACGRLAIALQQQHPTSAHARAQTACDADDATGCRVLGELELGGRRLVPTHPARPRFEQACEARDVSACLTLAQMHARLDTATAEQRRLELLERACLTHAPGSSQACSDLVALLESGAIDSPTAQAVASPDTITALERSYRPARRTRYLRLLLGVGVPSGPSAGLELLFPNGLPTRLSIAGEAGGLMWEAESAIGQGLGGSETRLLTGTAVLRIYTNVRGTGFYLAGGASLGGGTTTLAGGDLIIPSSLAGPTFRIGLHGQRALGLNLELGAIAPINQSEAPAPVLPVLSLRLGLSPG